MTGCTIVKCGYECFFSDKTRSWEFSIFENFTLNNLKLYGTAKGDFLGDKILPCVI